MAAALPQRRDRFEIYDTSANLWKRSIPMVLS